MGITIKELSEISGYSITTISRVITNKGNVKKETKEAVQKLLVQYNYRTNVMDFLKSEQSSKIIMVILGVLDNFYYSSLIKVIKEKTETYGYSVLIGYTDNSLEEEEKYVRMAIKEQYAGIFFMNVRGGNDLAELLKSGGVPVVFLNRGIRFAEFDSVTSDNYRGGYMITSYLIEMGHKKIGHLMGHTYSTVAQERRRGYEDAMNDAKLPVTRNSVHIGELNYESGYKYGEAIVKKGLDFTALFCGNDLMAIGLITALSESGLSVPDDVSVVCYDDTRYARDYGLTTVGAEPAKLGEKAVDILLAKIRGEQQESGAVVFRPHISERSSVKRLL